MRILSIDGGGYLGLASAAFLEELERHFGALCHQRFDLFCGTSTGAIIALGLASGLTASQIAALYRDFGPKVFKNNIPGSRAMRFTRGFLFSRYGNNPLKKALLDVFGETTLADVRQRGKYALIPAFSLTNGRPRIFKTDHTSRLSTDSNYRLRDIALASSAAPTYLPVVRLKSPTNGSEESYCDGGVYANNPALLAYTEATCELGVKPMDIQILSISTPRVNLAEYKSANGFLRNTWMSRGLLLWGGTLGSLFIDSSMEIADQTLRRLVTCAGKPTAQYSRIVIDKPAGIELDIADEKATETLAILGATRAAQSSIRDDLKIFFKD